MKRRERTREQWNRLHKSIMRNFHRYFPDGPVDMMLDEQLAQIAKGRLKSESITLNANRRPYRPGYRPQLLSGKWVRLDDVAHHGRRFNIKNWNLCQCGVCRKKFWVCHHVHYFCSTHCRDLARIHADALCFPPHYSNPITLRLRYWHLTHPFPGRQLEEIASKFFTSEADIMTRPNLKAFLEEVLPLSDDQAEALRARYAQILDRNATSVQSIITGRKDLTHNQTRVLLAVMDKVIPAAPAKSSSKGTPTIDLKPEDITKLSRQDLEVMLAKEKENVARITETS